MEAGFGGRKFDFTPGTENPEPLRSAEKTEEMVSYHTTPKKNHLSQGRI